MVNCTCEAEVTKNLVSQTTLREASLMALGHYSHLMVTLSHSGSNNELAIKHQKQKLLLNCISCNRKGILMLCPNSEMCN